MITIIDVTLPPSLMTLLTVFLRHPINSDASNQLTLFDVCLLEISHTVVGWEVDTTFTSAALLTARPFFLP